MKDEGANFYQSLDSTHLMGLPYISQPVAIALSNVTYFVAMTIQTLFCVLVFTTALLFKTLISRLSTISKDSGRAGSLMVDEWRKHYEMICRLIEEINSCFGLILIITFGHCFVTSAKFSTQIFNKDGRTRWGNYFFILGQLYVRLVLITVGSQYMHNQV